MKQFILFLSVIIMLGCVGNRQFDTQSNPLHDKGIVKKYSSTLFNKTSIPVVDRVNDLAKEAATLPAANEGIKLIESEDRISLAISDEYSAVKTIEKFEKPKENIESKFLKQAYRSFQNSTSALLLLGLAGLASIGLLKVGEKKSKELTHWSKRNPIISRSILVGAQSAPTLGGLALGHSMYNDGIMLPEFSRWIPAGIFTAAASFYPNKFYSGNIPAFTYMRRKAHDVALYTTGAMMMTYAGNHYSLSTSTQPVNEVVVSAANPFNRENKLSLVKKDFKARIESDNELKPMTKGEAAGAITGAVIGFIFLTLVVAGLSCSLSCSGNEGAAALVFVAGEGLLIWGLVSIIKRVRARLKLGANKPKPQVL